MLNHLNGESSKIETSSFALDLPEFHERFLRDAWRDNAREIARFYVGTDGMKADYVHTGKWPLSGMLRDGYTAIKRYWIGNFHDSKTQDFMDVLSGKLKPRQQPFKHNVLHMGQALLLMVLTVNYLGNWCTFPRQLPKPADHGERHPWGRRSEECFCDGSHLDRCAVGVFGIQALPNKQFTNRSEICPKRERINCVIQTKAARSQS